MIYYPLSTLIENGINDICIVSGREHMGDVMDLLGSGSEFGCDFTYKVQDKPDGIAGALKLCAKFAEWGNVAVILGDNIFLPAPTIKEGTKVYVKYMANASRFGVATFDFQGLHFVEKPDVNYGYVVTGLYVFDSAVWGYLDYCKLSKRGEYEITDVLNMYANDNNISTIIMDDVFWSDAGTFESMRETQEYLWRK
jgi:glucose-1-phosphate thymidylyltransferase